MLVCTAVILRLGYRISSVKLTNVSFDILYLPPFPKQHSFFLFKLADFGVQLKSVHIYPSLTVFLKTTCASQVGANSLRFHIGGKYRIFSST